MCVWYLCGKKSFSHFFPASMICGVNYFVQGLAHRRKYSQNPVPFERSDTLGVFVIWAQNWGGGEPYVFCSTNRFLQGVY
jgi:hypothetical protein